MIIQKILTSSLALFALTFVFASVLSGVAYAAPSADKTSQKAGGGGSSDSNFIGYDVSWPQCGNTLPSTKAFGIAGVNGGKASNQNPCLAEQLIWAKTATGTPNQDKVQTYVNTANPGEVIDQITTWPTDNVDPQGNTTENPHGTCDGANSLACSWQYGWDRSVEAAQNYFVPAAVKAGIDSNPGAYKWWLDVETENSWQSGSPEALARNVATIEGMTAYYQSLGARVGVYSTGYQWGVIVGDQVSAESSLNGLDSWLAGSRTLNGAKSKCSSAGLTATSKVVLTQYVAKNLDNNYSCVQ